MTKINKPKMTFKLQGRLLDFEGAFEDDFREEYMKPFFESDLDKQIKLINLSEESKKEKERSIEVLKLTYKDHHLTADIEEYPTLNRKYQVLHTKKRCEMILDIVKESNPDMTESELQEISIDEIKGFFMDMAKA